MIIKHRGVVRLGKFQPDYKEGFLAEFQRLEGKRVEVTVRPESKQRTNPQNKYYWGVVLRLISEETGYDTEELHNIFKGMFLREAAEITKGDKRVVIPYIKSTRDLDTKEFDEYIEKIKRWAAMELSLYIPDPNEVEGN